MWLNLIGRGARRADGHRIAGAEDRKGCDFVWMKGSGCFFFLRTHERTNKFFNHPSPSSLLPWDKRAAGGGRGPARALGQQAAWGEAGARLLWALTGRRREGVGVHGQGAGAVAARESRARARWACTPGRWDLGRARRGPWAHRAGRAWGG
jgi:hypothetical protein